MTEEDEEKMRRRRLRLSEFIDVCADRSTFDFGSQFNFESEFALIEKRCCNVRMYQRKAGPTRIMFKVSCTVKGGKCFNIRSRVNSIQPNVQIQFDYMELN